MKISRVLPMTLVVALACAGIGTAASAHEGDEHAHHAMIQGSKRTIVQYTVPEVSLVRDDGVKVSLRQEIDDGRPVVVDFIYTTCTAICPVTSQTLSRLQDELGADRDKVRIVSISIDPEQDTPARLAAYARKFGAGPEWHHYTGSVQASVTAQRAFGVYRGDKMDHAPVTLVRLAPGSAWVRIDGFATADELLGELRPKLAAQ